MDPVGAAPAGRLAARQKLRLAHDAHVLRDAVLGAPFVLVALFLGARRKLPVVRHAPDADRGQAEENQERRHLAEQTAAQAGGLGRGHRRSLSFAENRARKTRGANEAAKSGASEESGRSVARAA